MDTKRLAKAAQRLAEVARRIDSLRAIERWLLERPAVGLVVGADKALAVFRVREAWGEAMVDYKGVVDELNAAYTGARRAAAPN